MLEKLREWLPEIFVGMIVFALSISHMVNYTNFSPLDELRHLDYALQLTSGSLPKLGDKVQESSMREEACRGIDLIGWTNPDCGQQYLSPEEFRDDGWQTAPQHPPTYYLLSGLSSRLLKFIGVTGTFVDGARLFSGFIAALGMILTCRLSRRLQSSRLLSIMLPITVATSSVYLHQSSIVTPDSMAIFVGASILLVGFEYAQGLLSARWLYAVFILASLTKITNLLIVAVVTIALLTYFSVNKNKQNMDVLMAALTSFASGVSWIIFQSTRATINPEIVPQNQQLASDGLPTLTYLLDTKNIFSWFPPLNSYIANDFTNAYTVTLLVLLTWLLVGGVLFTILNFETRNFVSHIAISVLIVAICGAPFFIFASAFINKVLINAEPRYGMVLLPAFIVVCGYLIKTKFGTVLLSIFGVSLFISTMIEIWN
jgi:4-amino-4-deoxy-L-arabinose transferase-like glycosyltransferase